MYQLLGRDNIFEIQRKEAQVAYMYFVGEHIGGRPWRKPNDGVILGKNDFAAGSFHFLEKTKN